MATHVLVPGACHGGWWYDPVVERLVAAGHDAVAVTLAGLGPDGLAGCGQVTLDTHVEQVADLVAGSTGPVVLVGHSYAGSVVTGVADRLPGRVAALVYLDAFVPSDGDSCWSMTNDEQRAWYIGGAGTDGLGVEPLPFFDGRARPHPLATLVQRSRLTGAWRDVPVRHHVEALGWPDGSPMASTLARVRAEPGWVRHRWDTRHNVLADGPERVVDLLLGLS